MAQNYLDTLSQTQKNNARILVERMKEKGITNPYTHAAVLAVVSKESAFIPKSENLNYSAERIRQVWPRIPANIAVQLANNPEQLGNYVYGPSMNKTLGNKEGEGYKYRGRSYNQLTGRANYEKIGKELGYDFINNPDLLNDPKIAADVAIQFFKNGIDTMRRVGKLQEYNATDINDFKSMQDSLGAIYHVNAGVGSSKAKLDADTTGGRAKAISRLADLYTFTTGKVGDVNKAITDTTKDATEVVKKNPIRITMLTVGTIIAIVLIVKALKPEKP